MRSSRIAASLLVLLALAAGPAPASAAETTETTEDVSFQVTNPLAPGSLYTVRGTLVRPAGCASSVLLAQHGLSYGAWAWDFPLRPETYSVAQALGARGYAVVAIDRLGYGASDHPNGYTLTVESYADMTAQIVGQLRAGTYSAGVAFSHVGLIGHSAGSEVVELAAGLYGGVDVVIPTAYEHAPAGISTDWLVREWVTGDVVRASQSEYEYFETDPGTRAADMYNLEIADLDVVAKDTELANLTPSGEIYSISQQPSRAVMGSIAVPVLLVLAEQDALFPSAAAQDELALFGSAADRSVYVVPQAGHSFMLHPSAPGTNDVIADWLAARPGAMPAC
ncbi:MAG: alpha/beta fold hydrolase [Acidobacteria bacterium]|nr:alpha/beta fold hydrolase [Acidobacteriota bacterium]